MANPLLGLLTGLGGPPAPAGNGMSIMMQAVGAAMRGESAQDFMARLANERPELKSVNLNNLSGEADRLCREKGLDKDQLVQKIDGVVEPMIHK